ncbi:MAG: hypothetical protein A2Z21_07365 [Candidatus Fraserbacteria bacterium RBG_16_55_9]|uniref:Helix-turn-helix domain-containing protein n=1 Tax=Fraserbacteria sp. (strain RBG_16_55_9) TaxID=1817864 RepID=A0A1F5V0G8_FRAXR|nr:MAG: hypothetical protein A2Z21_07365 [Candidatus Fraserbacteria bacterium RBG_16_55_9]
MNQVGGYLKPWIAAQYLGIPLEEVQAMLESGELPGIKIAGQWRVPLDQLEAWLDEEVSPQELKKLAGRMKDVNSKKVDKFFKEMQPKSKKPKEVKARTQKPRLKKKKGAKSTDR